MTDQRRIAELERVLYWYIRVQGEIPHMVYDWMRDFEDNNDIEHRITAPSTTTSGTER